MQQNPNNPNKLNVSTQIRNFYSSGSSCLCMKFYNNTLSFAFYPFTGIDQNGRDQYDSKQGQQSTVNYESAYGLFKLSRDILDGKVDECNYSIQCMSGTLTLERKIENGKPETILSITKNNMTIPFRFVTSQYTVKENGNMITKTLDTGLGAFAKTIDGFLTGINSERHLNKLTDEYINIQEDKNKNKPYMNQPQGNNYQRNNQYNNQRRSYNYQRNNNQQWGQPQNFSDYTIQN